jgi:hypothetical protein
VKAAATATGGMFVNSSRAILYASAADEWQTAAAAEAEKTRQAIAEVFNANRPNPTNYRTPADRPG